MLGSFMRVTSGPLFSDSLQAFHLTGSLLHVASTLVGHIISELPERLRHNPAPPA